MGLQLIDQSGSDDEIRLNPSRDIAVFWPEIVEVIAEGLAREVWEPWFDWFCKLMGVDEDELMRAHACYFEAVQLARVPEIRTPLMAMQQAGFLDCKPAAQLVVLAKGGQLGFGAYYAGVRQAKNMKQDIPAVNGLAAYAKVIKDVLSAKFGADFIDFRKDKL